MWAFQRLGQQAMEDGEIFIIVSSESVNVVDEFRVMLHRRIVAPLPEIIWCQYCCIVSAGKSIAWTGRAGPKTIEAVEIMKTTACTVMGGLVRSGTYLVNKNCDQ